MHGSCVLVSLSAPMCFALVKHMDSKSDFILCGLLLATTHLTLVVHDHHLLAVRRRVSVPPSKPCSWDDPISDSGSCFVVGVRLGRLAACTVARNKGDVNGCSECDPFRTVLAVGCLRVREGCLLSVQTCE